ncbi:TPA: hypothetical protein HA246_04405 [Candidatus Woesearchaeota archaeon]|nr:hypothetical protein [Candidatus Woesearchaeota archaeon]
MRDANGQPKEGESAYAIQEEDVSQHTITIRVGTAATKPMSLDMYKTLFTDKGEMIKGVTAGSEGSPSVIETVSGASYTIREEPLVVTSSRDVAGETSSAEGSAGSDTKTIDNIKVGIVEEKQPGQKDPIIHKEYNLETTGIRGQEVDGQVVLNMKDGTKVYTGKPVADFEQGIATGTIPAKVQGRAYDYTMTHDADGKVVLRRNGEEDGRARAEKAVDDATAVSTKAETEFNQANSFRDVAGKQSAYESERDKAKALLPSALQNGPLFLLDENDLRALTPEKRTEFFAARETAAGKQRELNDAKDAVSQAERDRDDAKKKLESRTKARDKAVYDTSEIIPNPDGTSTEIRFTINKDKKVIDFESSVTTDPSGRITEKVERTKDTSGFLGIDVGKIDFGILNFGQGNTRGYGGNEGNQLKRTVYGAGGKTYTQMSQPFAVKGNGYISQPEVPPKPKPTPAAGAPAGAAGTPPAPAAGAPAAGAAGTSPAPAAGDGAAQAETPPAPTPGVTDPKKLADFEASGPLINYDPDTGEIKTYPPSFNVNDPRLDPQSPQYDAKYEQSQGAVKTKVGTKLGFGGLFGIVPASVKKDLEAAGLSGAQLEAALAEYKEGASKDRSIRFENAQEYAQSFGQLSSLFGDNGAFKAWNRRTDMLFNNWVLGGSEYRVSKICESNLRKVGDNVLVVQTPGGQLVTAAFVNGERQLLEFPNGTKQYLYKISYKVYIPESLIDKAETDTRRRIRAIDDPVPEAPARILRKDPGSGKRLEEFLAEGPFFNVILTGKSPKKCLFIDSGSKKCEGESVKKGANAVQRNMFVKYSTNVYNRVCIEFTRSLEFANKRSNSICADIVNVNEQPRNVVDVPEVPTVNPSLDSDDPNSDIAVEPVTETRTGLIVEADI